MKMWVRAVVILPILLAGAIKVPVDINEANSSDDVVVNKNIEPDKIPVYYEPQEVQIDSYLVPPDPHIPIEVIPDTVVTPATYLLPPAPEQTSFYSATNLDKQSDWYPIPQKDSSEIYPTSDITPENGNFDVSRTRKEKFEPQVISYTIPSLQLLPPLEQASSEYHIPENYEEPSLLEVNNRFDPARKQNFIIKKSNYNIKPSFNKVPIKYRLNPIDPTISIRLTPPKPDKYKNPTKLYPKKYSEGFKPIPIPLAQYADDPINTPNAKLIKPLKLGTSLESNILTPSDEKKIYLSEQNEQKHKLKGERESLKKYRPDKHREETQGEQDASETIYRNPGRNVYPAPLRQAPPTPQSDVQTLPPTGDRTEFRMHGMKGPHSYQFGYDTGKGKNRQFRFEERDNDGRVHGHYGYVDDKGKLRVVNYKADPELGFQAELPQEKNEPTEKNEDYE